MSNPAAYPSMASSSSPQSIANSVKLAVQKASAGDISELATLEPAVPPRILASIILQYLPESVDPSDYAAIIAQLLESQEEGSDALSEGLPFNIKPFTGTISQWVVSRAHQIDNATGDLSIISGLLSEFPDDPAISSFNSGIFASLEVLVYDFQGDWRLSELEETDKVIPKVLNEVDVETALERVLPGILGNDAESWSIVWRLMKEKGWAVVSPVLRDWLGPPGVELKRDFVKTGLEIAYEGKGADEEVYDVYEILRTVGTRFCQILEMRLPEDEIIGGEVETKDMFMEPTPFALKAFFTLITAAEFLGTSIGQALDYRVDASKEKQGFSLSSVIKNGKWPQKNEGEVEAHVTEIRTLRNFARVYARIDHGHFEQEILQGLLDAGSKVLLITLLYIVLTACRILTRWQVLYTVSGKHFAVRRSRRKDSCYILQQLRLCIQWQQRQRENEDCVPGPRSSYTVSAFTLPSKGQSTSFGYTRVVLLLYGARTWPTLSANRPPALSSTS